MVSHSPFQELQNPSFLQLLLAYGTALVHAGPVQPKSTFYFQNGISLNILLLTSQNCGLTSSGSNQVDNCTVEIVCCLNSVQVSIYTCDNVGNIRVYKNPLIL